MKREDIRIVTDKFKITKICAETVLCILFNVKYMHPCDGNKKHALIRLILKVLIALYITSLLQCTMDGIKLYC